MKKYHLVLGLLSGLLLINIAHADTEAVNSHNTNNNTISIQNSSSEPLLQDDNTITVPSTSDASSTTTMTSATTRVALPGDEHVVWNKQPIAFEVPTGKERMISFPDTIELINNNPDLTADKLTVTINNGTLYAKALQTFSPSRVTIKLQHTGDYVLLDISSVNDADESPLDVVIASSASNNANTESATTTDSTPTNHTTISYIDLLRFAIQSLYAPERLISQSDAIIRVPMATQKSIDLLYGGNTIAMPIVSWQGGDYFVTALVIKNTQMHSFILDPRQVKGNWLAAAFYPTNQLAANGKQQDKTTLFLISNSSFGHAFTDSDGERK